jgi:hypothetical protein
VNEYIRTGQHFAPEPVAVDRAGVPFGLSRLWPSAAGAAAPPADERRKALWGLVGEPAEGVAEALQLPTACVRYWLRRRAHAKRAK